MITSAANPLVKDVRYAVARAGLTEEGWCVAEGFHLLEEALRSDCAVRRVIAAESVRSAAEGHVRGLGGIPVTVVPDSLLQSISGAETSQGVISLVEPKEWKLEQLFRGDSLLVVLDGLQDPGNAGAIVRAAEAFGASGVMFLKGTASPFNSKTLRAAAGSLFRIPFLHGLDASLARAALQQNRVTLYAAVPAGKGALAQELGAVDLTARCALAIGNEARGVSSSLRSAALDVSIPTVGVESLNAAVAAGIILYEARRQRARRA